MDPYRVVLFLHILTFAVAAAMSSVLHFTMLQRQRATTVREALKWHAAGGGVAKFFPLVLITFVATGAYLVSRIWTWQTSFVEAGIAGVVLLLANGIFMGTRARSIVPLLVRSVDGPMTPELRATLDQPVLNTLPWVNHMLSLGIAFVMTVKPALTGSLAVLGVAIALGLLLGHRFRPAAVSVSVPATS